MKYIVALFLLFSFNTLISQSTLYLDDENIKINHLENPYLNVSTNDLDTDSFKDSLYITSNIWWYAHSDNPNVFFSQDSGFGNGKLYILFGSSENKATITISGIGVQNQVVSVSKKAPYITVSENSIKLSSSENLTKSIDVTSNVSWKASSNQSWVKLNTDNGFGSKALTFTAESNTLSNYREAVITIFGSSLEQRIYITQDEYKPFLNTKSNSLNLSSSETNLKFELNTNTSWNLSHNQNWLNYDKVTGNGSATVTIIANANTSINPRIDTILVTGLGVSTLKIIVTQDGLGPTLSVSASNLKISAKANSTNTFDIISNSKWNLALDQNWLSANNISGNGNATISLTAQENSSTVTRNCNVIVTVSGLSSKTITVNQDASVKSYVETEIKNSLNISLFPNPSSDLIAIQSNNITDENVVIELFDASGKFIKRDDLFQASTITYFDTKTLYSGEYIIKFTKGSEIISKRVILNK